MSNKTETSKNLRIFYLLRLLTGFIALKIISFFADLIPYAKQGFFCDDDEIRYPKMNDTVDANVMDATFVVISVVLVSCVEYTLIRHLTTRRGHRLSPRQTAPLHPGLYSICYFLLSILCMYLTVDVIVGLGKRTISRPRPNFLAICQPNLDELCPPGNQKYVENYVCYGEEFGEMYFSFPSGHSALSVAFATFVIYYLHKRCKFPEPICALLQLALALFAFFVCLSRVRDHKHRLSDVAGGASVGAATAIFFIHFVMRGFKNHRYETEERVERFFETRKVSPSIVVHETKTKRPSMRQATSEYGSFCNSSTEYLTEKADKARTDIP